MESHFIILFDDYINKRTIGLHKHFDNCGIPVGYLESMDILKSKFPHLNFDVSYIVTDSVEADSIPKYDSYYEKVVFIEYENIDYFVKCIQNNLVVRDIDVANIILTKKTLDYDSLVNMLDKVNKDYKVKYGEFLFSELNYDELRDKYENKLNPSEFEKSIIWCRFRKFENYEKILEVLNSSLNVVV